MSRRAARTWVAGPVADSLIAEYGMRTRGGAGGNWARYAGLQDRGVAAAYNVEIAALLRNAPTLERAVQDAYGDEGRSKIHPRARAVLIDLVDDELHNGQSHTRLSLEALLAVDGRVSSDEEVLPAAAPEILSSRKPRKAGHIGFGASARRVRLPLVLLNGIIGLVLLVGPGLSWALGERPPADTPALILLSVCAIWALAFMPGWLFVRFLDRRAGALWDEYVIHLYRLGLDEPAYLPEPPVTSAYHARWVSDGGLARLRMRNIYREKFDAYYGRSVSRFGTDVDRPVRPEALFPVFLCTALLAVAWTAALYDPVLTFGSAAEPTIWTWLSFAFTGAYVFFMQMLLRRYFQADLRAGAYVSGYVRVVTALLIVVAVHAAVSGNTPASVAVATAFIIGWFPNAGVQCLIRVVSRRLRGTVPSLEPAYPLNRLDGLNLWYETRLLEEGIEDLQNLVTAKIVDVLLHTRVPVARLVDWIDQALLLIHLPSEPAAVDQRGFTYKKRARAALESRHERLILRRCGIRSATALIRALHDERDQNQRDLLLKHLDDQEFSRHRVLALEAILASDTRLGPVYNWQGGEVKPRRPLPLLSVS